MINMVNFILPPPPRHIKFTFTFKMSQITCTGGVGTPPRKIIWNLFVLFESFPNGCCQICIFPNHPQTHIQILNITPCLPYYTLQITDV